ncbi:MAG: hypothetical protein ACTSSJ_05635 [Candidatus Odinarchaeia archaeon]
MKKEMYYTFNTVSEIHEKLDRIKDKVKIKIENLEEAEGIKIIEETGGFRGIINPVISETEVKLKMRITLLDDKFEPHLLECFGKPELTRKILPSILEVSKDIVNIEFENLDELIAKLSKKYNLSIEEMSKYPRRILNSVSMPGVLPEVKKAADKLRPLVED